MGHEGSGEIRVGVVGLGDVVLRYFWPGAEKYMEDHQDMQVTAIAARGSWERRLEKLQALCQSGDEKERQSASAFIAGINSDSFIYHAIGEDEKLPDEFFDSIDAVYVATTNDTHRTYTDQAIARGKHVLCEKPLASGRRDVQAMARAAELNPDIACQIVSHYAYKKPFLVLREKLHDWLKDCGGLSITYFDARILQEMSEDVIYDNEGRQVYRPRLANTVLNRKKGGGIIMDTVIHPLSHLLAIGGRIYDVLDSDAYNFDESVFDAETAFKADVRVAGPLFDDTTAHLEAAKFMNEKKKSLFLEIGGGVGEISVVFEDKIRYERNGRTQVEEPIGGFSFSDNPYTNSLSSFIRCIREGRKPMTPFSHGVDEADAVRMVKQSLSAKYQGRLWHPDPLEFYASVPEASKV